MPYWFLYYNLYDNNGVSVGLDPRRCWINVRGRASPLSSQLLLSKIGDQRLIDHMFILTILRSSKGTILCKNRRHWYCTPTVPRHEALIGIYMRIIKTTHCISYGLSIIVPQSSVLSCDIPWRTLSTACYTTDGPSLTKASRHIVIIAQWTTNIVWRC